MKDRVKLTQAAIITALAIVLSLATVYVPLFVEEGEKIVAFKEVSERYEFLKGQHDDLIIAKEKLIAIIEELDAGMRSQFSEKFEEIKKRGKFPLFFILIL